MLSRAYHVSHLPYYHSAAEHSHCSTSLAVRTQESLGLPRNADCVSKIRPSQLLQEVSPPSQSSSTFSYAVAVSQLSTLMPCWRDTTDRGPKGVLTNPRAHWTCWHVN